MGQYVMIVVAGMVISASVLMMTTASDTADADVELHEYQSKVLARDLAMTGLNLTLRRLAQDGDQPWTNADKYSISKTEYNAGQFETDVTLIDGNDTVDVRSTGYKNIVPDNENKDDSTVTHVIQIRAVHAKQVNDDDIPPGFEVAILTDSDLNLSGNFTVESYDPSLNADVHSNGILEADGNAFTVEGYGTGTGGVDYQTNSADNFQPNDDRNGEDPNIFEQDSIPVPQLDLDELRNDANVYHGGDVNVSGSAIGYSDFRDWAEATGDPGGGTKDDPFVFFAEGSLDFVEDLDLDGYGVFVSGNDMRINSNVEIIGHIGADDDGLPTTKMGIFTGGDLHVNGGSEIVATMYSLGQIRFNGTTEITGGVVGSSIGTWNGTADLNWVGPSEGIVETFGSDPGWTTREVGAAVLAWAEW